MYKTGDAPGAGTYECLTCKNYSVTLISDNDTIPECATTDCSGDIWARVY